MVSTYSMFFPKISAPAVDVAYMSGNRIYRPLPNVVDVFLAKLNYAHTAFIDMYSDEMWHGPQPKDTKIILNRKYRHIQ
jgi:hypothetical protein